MGTGLMSRLEADWLVLCQTGQARRRFAAWRLAEAALAELATLEDVRAATEHRGDKVRSDRTLAALSRLAAGDGGDDVLAARVLLQLLLPGATRLARSIAAHTGDGDQAEADVVAELTALIRTYPWRRRPRAVAANLLMDCQQRLSREHRRKRVSEFAYGATPDLHQLRPAAAEGRADSDVVDEQVQIVQLFCWATRTGVLSVEEALVIAESRVDEVPITEIVRTTGLSRSALFAMRRDGSEKRLREALPEFLAA